MFLEFFYGRMIEEVINMFQNDTNYLDQHFLVDESIINKMITESHLQKSDIVVEVGPGKGTLTKLIAPLVSKLYCIELDKRLQEYLNPICAKYHNIEVIYQNVLNTYIPDCNKMITSLPYSILEPFMYKMIRCHFNELIMITGKKYVDSLSTITKLSLLTNAFFKVDVIMDIPPLSFAPSPRVMSSMIRLTPLAENKLSITYQIIRHLFYYHDMKIKNALMETLIKINHMTKKEAKALITQMNISNSLLEEKFETLSNTEANELYQLLQSYYQ